MRLTGWIVALAWALAAPAAAQTTCAGANLVAALPPAEQAALRASVEGVPHARGLLWEARRGDARLVLAGTYHFGDARLEALVDRLRPEIAGAAALYVEAGPEEEARLAEALASDPTLMVAPEGESLADRLAPADWDALKAAMAERGMPGPMTARLRPWYVATMLSLSPCMLAAAQAGDDAGGLDHRLIAAAEDAGTKVVALERWDTLFTLFEGLSDRDEVDMIRSALPAAAHADDYAQTLLDAYFAEDIWLIWEFGVLDARRGSGLTEAEVDAQMALMQDRLIDRRNAAWIAPLEAAAEAAAPRSVVAGFGALHLPGEGGVLNLLAQSGWTITPLR